VPCTGLEAGGGTSIAILSWIECGIASRAGKGSSGFLSAGPGEVGAEGGSTAASRWRANRQGLDALLEVCGQIFGKFIADERQISL